MQGLGQTVLVGLQVRGGDFLMRNQPIVPFGKKRQPATTILEVEQRDNIRRHELSCYRPADQTRELMGAHRQILLNLHYALRVRAGLRLHRKSNYSGRGMES